MAKAKQESRIREIVRQEIRAVEDEKFRARVDRANAEYRRMNERLKRTQRAYNNLEWPKDYLSPHMERAVPVVPESIARELYEALKFEMTIHTNSLVNPSAPAALTRYEREVRK